MVSSFDIFDTCVVRRCGCPLNIFDILSYRVFNEPVPDESRLEFIAQRLSADQTSTFGHIYDTFAYHHPSIVDKQTIMQKELECEREMIVPVYAMKQKVRECREKGDHIIFISDMYLPTEFLKSILVENELFVNGDSIYVSGDIGMQKADGTLFQWIKEKEGISFSKWIHIGDNVNGDYIQPKKFGIRALRMNIDYLPYEKDWKERNMSNKYNYSGIMAGIGRSLFSQIPPTPYNAFAIDIAAPFLTTFACRILLDATRKKIRNLFFCARDCYSLWKVAKHLSRIFPLVECEYLHISRKALYESEDSSKIAYFERVGLASNSEISGIVDMRSTGQSLKYLNHLLAKYNYKPVYGYYFEMFCSGDYLEDVPAYYCEINQLYNSHLNNFTVGVHWPIFESYFAMKREARTINYYEERPVFETKEEETDCYIEDVDFYSEINETILHEYVESFISTNLYIYNDDIFDFIVLPSLYHFFRHPSKIYLLSLTKLYVRRKDNTFVPYIKKRRGLSTKLREAFERAKTVNQQRILRLLMLILKEKIDSYDVWWAEGTRAFSS